MTAADESCLDSPRAMLLTDMWGGHSNRQMRAILLESDIYNLEIPRHTTGDLQPLDVGFFRQYKILLKRLTQAAIDESHLDDITSRSGIINMNSLV